MTEYTGNGQHNQSTDPLHDQRVASSTNAVDGASKEQAAGDGRHIDPALGTLIGEGAQQRHESPRTHPDREPFHVWPQQPTASQKTADGPTYYDRPVIKEPVWIWTVPLYFFIGGAAGAASVLGAVAQVLGGQQLRGLVTRCRWFSAIGASVGAVLLILDLGRPARFLNMLRIFRPTSPMSVGSWILVGAGGVMSVAAVLNRFRGWLKLVGDGAGIVSSLFGIGLMGYTGVLLTNTVVPLWVAARRSLPVLFISSGMASAAAFLELMPATPKEAKVVRHFGQMSRLAEVVVALIFDAETKRVERVGRPLTEGFSGSLWKASKLLSGMGLLLAWLPTNARWKRLTAAFCTAASALALRYAIMLAGKASARDPRATFDQQHFFIEQGHTRD